MTFTLFFLACSAPKLTVRRSYPPLYKTTPPREASISAPEIIDSLSAESVFSFSLPDPFSQKKGRGKKLSLWATYYYTPIFPYSKNEKYHILDLDGKAFGPKLSAKDWCNGALQGSFSISQPNGHIETFNYAGLSKKMQVNCKPYHRFTRSGRIRFQRARGPYGDGATGVYSLIPLRSIAVDPQKIPYGTVIYIPKARGLEIKLSDKHSIVHDGYFFANDTGGAIKKNHIDVYSGNYIHKELRNFVRSTSSETFSAYIIDDVDIQTIMKQAHLDIVYRGHVFAEEIPSNPKN